MTVPNTPPGTPQGGNPLGTSADLPQGTDQDAPRGLLEGAADSAQDVSPSAAQDVSPGTAQDAAPDVAQDAASGTAQGAEALGATAAQRPAFWKRLLRELRVGAPILLACLLLGLLLGALWYWLAPEVPLVVHGQSVLYVDPEGEQRAGADGTFVLLGLAFGLITAVGAFLLTRGRGGGIVVAVMLALGGLAGSLIAWPLGIALGPTKDLIGHAKQVGDGHTFNEALQLSAHGALFAWPMAALVALLALTAAFGKREQDPPPYWAGPVLPSAGGPVDELKPPTGVEGSAGSAGSAASGADCEASSGAGAPSGPDASSGPGRSVGAQAVGAQAVGEQSAPADLGADSTRQPQ
ncbi:hypothetical protein [Kitasatospora kifunensis]|uniref:ABC transporter permease n=1 Tax=Kitasatospora kifunensis TaxID=58351 RepID=A0A7W7VUG5_KITKI|nr:hypothetical protein [Kitasatospora kifunensis]MBB4922813.1 hypothetical protein [Kitasatospora kifunensis]